MALYESSKAISISKAASSDSTDHLEICLLTVPTDGKYAIIFGATTNKSGTSTVMLEYYTPDGDPKIEQFDITGVNSSSSINLHVIEDYLTAYPDLPIGLYTQDHASGKWFSGYISIVQIE